MKIITISREFGSGGRELGKRLADALGFHYYDTEIIREIAKETSFSEEYITSVTERGLSGFNVHFGRTFTPQVNQTAIDVLVAQHNVIKRLAEKGDSVFVGYGADVILKDLNPLKIFVCADVQYKLKRCREKNQADAHLSDREMIKQFNRIDSGRRHLHEQLASSEWGESKAYNLSVNTTGFEIKEIVPAVKEFALKWFEKTQNN